MTKPMGEEIADGMRAASKMGEQLGAAKAQGAISRHIAKCATDRHQGSPEVQILLLNLALEISAMEIEIT